MFTALSLSQSISKSPMHFFFLCRVKESQLESKDKFPAPPLRGLCEPCHGFCTSHLRDQQCWPTICLGKWVWLCPVPSTAGSWLVPLACCDPELGGQPSSSREPQGLTLFTSQEVRSLAVSSWLPSSVLSPSGLSYTRGGPGISFWHWQCQGPCRSFCQAQSSEL